MWMTIHHLKRWRTQNPFFAYFFFSLYWDSTYQDMATRPYNNKWWKNVLVLGCLCWSDEDLEAEKEMLISSNVSDKRHHWIFNLKAKLCSWELLIIYYRQGKALFVAICFLFDGCHFYGKIVLGQYRNSIFSRVVGVFGHFLANLAFE